MYLYDQPTAVLSAYNDAIASLILGEWGATGRDWTWADPVHRRRVTTSGDVSYRVNYTFEGGLEPLPVAMAGDADCGRVISSADTIRLVDHVFKGGEEPCPSSNSGL
jgi:hypothetical protein